MAGQPASSSGCTFQFNIVTIFEEGAGNILHHLAGTLLLAE